MEKWGLSEDVDGCTGIFWGDGLRFCMGTGLVACPDIFGVALVGT